MKIGDTVAVYADGTWIDAKTFLYYGTIVDLGLTTIIKNEIGTLKSIWNFQCRPLRELKG